MKTTIVTIFLLTILVKAQVYDNWTPNVHTGRINSDVITPIDSTIDGYEIEGCFGGESKKEPYFIPSVFSLMKEYEVECYVDSSIDYKNCIFDFVPDTTSENHIHYKPIKIIVYKYQEPTYKGFKEYLKRKDLR